MTYTSSSVLQSVLYITIWLTKIVNTCKYSLTTFSSQPKFKVIWILLTLTYNVKEQCGIAIAHIRYPILLGSVSTQWISNSVCVY